MFGYVTPVKDKLRQQDFVLYRSFYCGICAQIGRDYGALPRFTTTYDATFLALLVHDITEQEVEFEESRCVGNPFTKKLMIKGNELLKRVCASNVVLSYYKLCDDVIDEGGVKKRLARAAMSKAYKKAAYYMPAVDEIVKRRYEELRRMEKAGEGSVDKVAHCFAMLLRETCEVVVKSHPLGKRRVPAGRNRSSPVKSSPARNLVRALRNSGIFMPTPPAPRRRWCRA